MKCEKKLGNFIVTSKVSSPFVGMNTYKTLPRLRMDIVPYNIKVWSLKISGNIAMVHSEWIITNYFITREVYIV